jgi:pimeloyl-ACP methyl ester carboxylesterase
LKPAGVGIGRKPPTYLKSGDEVEVSVTGLGSLSNRIGSPESFNPTIAVIQEMNKIPSFNVKAVDSNGLTKINDKLLYYRQQGQASAPNLVFVHGLGGTSDYWTPLVQAAQLDQSHNLHFFDLEGHGLSPTSPLSKLSIESFAGDVKGVFDHANNSGATLFAHSMGCLVAVRFVLDNPGLVSRLILVGPPPSPLPAAASTNSHARAHLVRTKGMSAVVDAIVAEGTSSRTKSHNPLAATAVRLSLLGQDPEGYAKACAALANATTELDFTAIKPQTLIITGSEDKVSPPQLCEKYAASVPHSSSVVVLEDVGHWHVYEDVEGVSHAVSKFLSD